VIVPLLLLATPHRDAVGPRHHTGADRARAGADDTMTPLSTSWTIPFTFTAFITTAPATSATATTTSTTPVAGPRTDVENESFRSVLPTTTTTTMAPRAPTPTTAPKAVPPAPKPVPVPVPTTVAPPQDATTGEASWYGAPAGTCASPSLEFGTVVTVTDLSTRTSVRCRVDDRQAHAPGRVLDLSEDTFSQLASPWVGVIEVRLSW
jgi:rare lipoprotein A (peptidoglycan hydrolase)